MMPKFALGGLCVAFCFCRKGIHLSVTAVTVSYVTLLTSGLDAGPVGHGVVSPLAFLLAVAAYFKRLEVKRQE